MKRKFFSVLLTLVLILSLSLVTAVPVGAYSPDDYTDAITETADRLVLLQGPDDGGWQWIITGHTTPDDPQLPGSFNLFGVTALGLIDAYEVTGNVAYYNAAQLTANHLLAVDRGEDPDARIQTFDYRFLVEFSALSADLSYKEHAIEQWLVAQAESAWHYADGNQENIYIYWFEHISGGSHGYAFWQAADCGLATLAMGDTPYASDMAAVLVSHLGEIALDDEYRFIGWGHALEFLIAVDPVAYSTQIAGLIGSLTNSQNEDGSWGAIGGNPEGIAQDTAYAVMGLAAAGRTDAILRSRYGADWLVANQGYTINIGGEDVTIDGGWLEPAQGDPPEAKEYSETDSEALQAIKSVLGSGAVSIIAVSEPAIIGISVSPSTIYFGAITSGVTRSGPSLTVMNIGNVPVVVDAEIIADTFFDVADSEYFYTAALKFNEVLCSGDLGDLGGTWAAAILGLDSIAVGQSGSVSTKIECPSLIKADTTYEGTVVFWAEQPAAE